MSGSGGVHSDTRTLAGSLRMAMQKKRMFSAEKALMEKLGRPTLFCNTLSIASDGAVTGYNLRQKDGKRKVARALQNLNYEVTAIGDSYNDITMLKEAENGILFRPPDNVREEFTEFPVAVTYDELKKHIQKILNNSGK